MNATGDWREPAARLAESMTRQGLDADWAACFAAVPRHEFVAGGHLIDERGVAPAQSWDRAQLLRQAYADQVIVTRYEVVAGQRIATSSASQPSIVAAMLRLLDVGADSRVLEIGTGPGYNAALLCQRLGDQRVTSVDIQEDVVAEARDRLARLGHRPHLDAVDGALGYPGRAPFDRVIATCGLSSIPSPWFAQLAPGARVVAPMSFGGALAVLDLRADGTLSGGFPDDAGFFMGLRRPGDPAAATSPASLEVGLTMTELGMDVLGSLDFRLWLELTLPGAQLWPTRVVDGAVVEIQVTQDDARADVVKENSGVWVTQYGQPLWGCVEAAARAWIDNDRPLRTRFGLTAAPDRQWAWLDAPDSAVTWEL